MDTIVEMSITKVGFGGGCHWCTEAVFQALVGVKSVEQGWIASTDGNSAFSEAVVVHFNASEVSLSILIKAHLMTHSSTSNHSMRKKFRSAVYTFNEDQAVESTNILQYFQEDSADKIITKVYPFSDFKPSRNDLQNYYLKNPLKPFCEKYIAPKLKLVEGLNRVNEP